LPFFDALHRWRRILRPVLSRWPAFGAVIRVVPTVTDPPKDEMVEEHQNLPAKIHYVLQVASVRADSVRRRIAQSLPCFTCLRATAPRFTSSRSLSFALPASLLALRHQLRVFTSCESSDCAMRARRPIQVRIHFRRWTPEIRELLIQDAFQPPRSIPALPHRLTLCSLRAPRARGR